MSAFLAALCLGSTAVLVVGEVRHLDGLRIASKTLASSCFVALAVIGGAGASPFGRWVIGALVLSMVGDLCLLSRGKGPFLAGLVAFLLGHVAYVGAFLSLGISVAGAALMAVPLAVVAWAVWRWLADRVGRLGRPVAAYIVVISTMVACAFGALAAAPDPWRAGLVVAAVLFFLSDLCVARDRFVAPGAVNRTVGLPLYYVAQVLFAWLAAA